MRGRQWKRQKTTKWKMHGVRGGGPGLDVFLCLGRCNLETFFGSYGKWDKLWNVPPQHIIDTKCLPSVCLLPFMQSLFSGSITHTESYILHFSDRTTSFVYPNFYFFTLFWLQVTHSNTQVDSTQVESQPVLLPPDCSKSSKAELLEYRATYRTYVLFPPTMGIPAKYVPNTSFFFSFLNFIFN